MIALSAQTRRRLVRLFPDPDQARQATDLLEHECAETLPGWHGDTPEAFERIRFAVLKLSEGRLDALLNAVLLAQADWRDALVFADFGTDITAHEAWEP